MNPQADRSANADEMAGAVIGGRYTVERTLAQSERTQTLLASRSDIGQRVVIKVLRSVDDDSDTAVKRFSREIKATASVEHPNVVSIFDAGTTADGRPYFVMEHVDGILLADVIRHDAPMPPARAFGITRQITAAVSAAHAAGVFHRDLKPDDIFVSTRNGRRDFITVGDFAVAKLVGEVQSLTIAGTLFGNTAYLAPEKGDPKFKAPEGFNEDAAADVYAIGCIAFEMLVGRPPLTDPSVLKQMLKRMRQAPDWPADAQVPTGLKDAVEALLSADVTKRPSSAFEALRLLDQLDPKAADWHAPVPRVRTRQVSQRSAAVTPRRPHPTGKTGTTPPRPAPQVSQPPAWPVNAKTLGRGMLERPQSAPSLAKVQGVTNRGLFVSIFARSGAVNAGDGVTLKFPGPRATGGKVSVTGVVRGQPSVDGRSLRVFVELDASASGRDFAALKRRWLS